MRRRDGADAGGDDAGGRLGELLSVDVGDRPGGTRARRRPGGRRRTGLLSSAFSLVLLIVTGVVLFSTGIGVIRSSTHGELFSPLTDPRAPGFEALVEPTPTMAVLHEVDGVLDAVTILTLPEPGRGGGGVISVPAGVQLPDGERLAAVHDPSRPRTAADRVGDLVGVAIGEVTVVTPARWTSLVSPVAPLVIDNSDPVEADGVAFPVGRIRVDAEDVSRYLSASTVAGTESDLARLFRHGLFWSSWLEAVVAADRVDAVPGELDAGLGFFVRRLARGPVDVEVLPVLEAPRTEAGSSFRGDDEAIGELVAELVPLPASPRPGARPRVRVLNGTTDVDAATSVAPTLAVAHVSVVLVGNADTLDHEVTTVAYVSPEHEDEAVAIRGVLGVGRVTVDDRPTDAADITVTLGADHG